VLRCSSSVSALLALSWSARARGSAKVARGRGVKVARSEREAASAVEAHAAHAITTSTNVAQIRHGARNLTRVASKILSRMHRNV
jgi:hypothetical protein